jgi:hypothetical protein
MECVMGDGWRGGGSSTDFCANDRNENALNHFFQNYFIDMQLSKHQTQ